MNIIVQKPEDTKDSEKFYGYLKEVSVDIQEIVAPLNGWNIEFKPGWTKMDNSSGYSIFDPEGRLRFIFKVDIGKPTIISFLTRFYVVLDPKNKTSPKKCNTWRSVVLDRPTMTPLYHGVYDKFNSRSEAAGTFKNRIIASGENFLNERYPDWRNPLAYWD